MNIKICSIAAGLLCCVQAFAQYPVHTIEVGRFKDLNKGALTITDGHYITTSYYDNHNRPVKNGGRSFGLTWGVAEVENNGYKPGLLASGMVVTEINGKLTEGMTLERFYSILDDAETFSLGIQDRSTKETVTVYLQKQSPVQNSEVRDWIPVNIQNYPGRHNWKIYPVAYSFIDGLVSIPQKEVGQLLLNERNITKEERVDHDFDFSACNTYDIVNSDRDVEEIVKGVLPNSWMTKSPKNPDLTYSVSHGIRNGQEWDPYYSSLTGRPNHFFYLDLEIKACDSEGKEVWYMSTSQKRGSYSNTYWYTSYKDVFNCPELTLRDRMVQVDRAYIKRSGIIQDEANPSIIAYVEPGSRAEKAGFQAGDRLIKAVAEADYTKAYRSWGMTNGIGDDVDFKITVNSFSDGFFDDMNVRWVQKDEHIPYNNIDGFLYEPFLATWLSSERFRASERPWGNDPGQCSAFLEWKVTVKRGKQKIKLVMPHAIADGYLVVHTTYIK